MLKAMGHVKINVIYVVQKIQFNHGIVDNPTLDSEMLCPAVEENTEIGASQLTVVQHLHKLGKVKIKLK